MLKQIFILLFVFVFSTAYSQSISTSLRKAKNHVERGEYYLAATDYLAVLSKDSLNPKANREYGLLQTQYINSPGHAGVYLLRAERQSKKDTLPELILALAQYYHSQAQYQKALTYYRRMFAFIENNKDGKILESVIKRNIANCEYASSSPSAPVYKRIQIVNIGADVNTIYPEYVPVVNKDFTVLMFTSRRKNNKGNKIDDYDGNYYEDMYLARKDQDGKFKNAHPFSDTDPEVKGLSNTGGHEAVVSLSQSGDKFFTYRNNQVFESDLQNNVWSAPKLLDKNINAANGFQSHVSITSDGKTMYFSSERPGGIGGLDLYKSDKNENGAWGPAVNLGASINTDDDDDSPYISHDGKTLYFASKGHPGYGGYDLFKCTKNGTTWDIPENMGTPFNSSGDETHLNYNANETQGFFSSSRSGGFGDMDIYEIRFEKPFSDFKTDPLQQISFIIPDTAYVGDTLNFNVNHTKLPPSVFKNYYWQVGDSILPSDKKGVYVFTKTGNYAIRMQAENNEDALIGVEKNIFISDKKPVIVATNTTVATNTNPGFPALELIYFDFNKSGLNEAAKTAIEKNMEILKNYPDIRIEISAYCDSRGASSYNQRLSEKRAKATIKYLKKKGFSLLLVKQVEWFGEKNPVNKCTDEVPCTEEEYKLNRRVEFKLTNFKK